MDCLLSLMGLIALGFENMFLIKDLGRTSSKSLLDLKREIGESYLRKEDLRRIFVCLVGVLDYFILKRLL